MCHTTVGIRQPKTVRITSLFQQGRNVSLAANINFRVQIAMKIDQSFYVRLSFAQDYVIVGTLNVDLA